MKPWSVYLLKCCDNSLYCGVTTDMDNRLLKHARGVASKYTRSRLPVQLMAICDGLSKQAAFKLEYRIKQLPSEKKITTLENIEL